MSSIIPCKSCVPASCLGQGSTIDPAILYSLSGPTYEFVFNCPAGIDCANAPYLLLQCCDEIVFLNLLGITGRQRTRLINGALTRCANFWQTCGQFNGGGGSGGGGNGSGDGRRPIVQVYYNQNPACCPVLCNGQYVSYCLQPGTVISPVPRGADVLAGQIACGRAAQGKIQIDNNRQCFTAACAGGDPFTATRCVEAGEFGECLFFPDPTQIISAQQFYDGMALDIATTEANQALAEHGCLVCNVEVTGTAACPGNPSKISTQTVLAGTFCMPAGTDQAIVDAQATQLLYTNLQTALVAQGCVCKSTITLGTYVNGNCPVGMTTVPDITLLFTCDSRITMSPAMTIPQPMFFAAGTGFNWHLNVGALLGICTRVGQVTFTPFDYTAPAFTFWSG